MNIDKLLSELQSIIHTSSDDVRVMYEWGSIDIDFIKNHTNVKKAFRAIIKQRREIKMLDSMLDECFKDFNEVVFNIQQLEAENEKLQQEIDFLKHRSKYE